MLGKIKKFYKENKGKIYVALALECVIVVIVLLAVFVR